jgi:hypothetical protein
MADPIRPTTPHAHNHGINGSESEAEGMCVPPKPEKCEEPNMPDQARTPPASTEPTPSPRAVDLLVSRAGRRPVAADSPSHRAGSRPLSAQAETGVTRSGDHYADIALARGTTSGGHTVELASATVQAGAQNEASVTALRVQSQTTDGKTVATSELFTARAAVSTRMLPGCDGAYVAAGANAAQTESSYRYNEAEESSFGLSAGSSFEAGICHRDNDNDGVPETCFRVGAGPLVASDCSEPSQPPPHDDELGTGGGPSHYADQPPTNLGAGGNPGYQ